MREMTEDEQETLRAGLRMIARMIARRHLARQAADAAEAGPEHDPAIVDLGGAEGGVER